jgi:TDG/mug DNA glycosylase family protein
MNDCDAILPDVLVPGLQIVFVGTAAGNASARARAYFAGPGNQFWPTLHAIGLTPRLLAPSEFAVLPTFGIGLTDVAKRRSGVDRVLTHSDFDVEGFRAKIASHRPRIVAFNGKKAASLVLMQPTSALHYGPQTDQIEGASIFVLPSTSGAARGFWDLQSWADLADALKTWSDVCQPVN